MGLKLSNFCPHKSRSMGISWDISCSWEIPATEVFSWDSHRTKSGCSSHLWWRRVVDIKGIHIPSSPSVKKSALSHWRLRLRSVGGGLFFGDWWNPPMMNVKKFSAYWGIIQYMTGLWLLWAIPIHAQPHTITIETFTHRIFSWGNCLQNWDLAKHGVNSETNSASRLVILLLVQTPATTRTHAHTLYLRCMYPHYIHGISPLCLSLLISPWYIPMIIHRNKNNHLIFGNFQKSRDPVLIYYFCLGFSMN